MADLYNINFKSFAQKFGLVQNKSLFIIEYYIKLKYCIYKRSPNREITSTEVQKNMTKTERGP